MLASEGSEDHKKTLEDIQKELLELRTAAQAIVDVDGR